jgi:hypothetical protein
METIQIPNRTFDFYALSLIDPIQAIKQTDTYFTKILYKNKPLYIETPKCLTKNGIIKSNRKFHCDLMFNINDAEFIQWVEDLEQTCQNLILNSKTWFKEELTIDDIDNAFQSSIKIYKSGKFYLLKVAVKNDHKGDPSLAVYDESENPLKYNEITGETNVISILEIQGIKFSTKYFIIVIEMKQMMVLTNDQTFSNCLIKTNKPIANKYNNEELNKPVIAQLREPIQEIPIIKEDPKEITQEIAQEIAQENNIIEEMFDINNFDDKLTTIEEVKIKSVVEPIVEINKKDKKKKSKNKPIVQEMIVAKNSVNFTDDDNIINLDFSALPMEVEDEKEMDRLEEVNFDWNNLEEEENNHIELKKPSDIYHKMYNEALEKAKEAQLIADLAMKEAENIKLTYLL